MATLWLWSYFYKFLPSKKCWLQNPVCLTFCAVTWLIFHVGWKARWVSESKFRGLFNGYENFLCMCSRTWENNKNKVDPMIWDTLYICYNEILFISPGCPGGVAAPPPGPAPQLPPAVPDPGPGAGPHHNLGGSLRLALHQVSEAAGDARLLKIWHCFIW